MSVKTISLQTMLITEFAGSRTDVFGERVPDGLATENTHSPNRVRVLNTV